MATPATTTSAAAATAGTRQVLKRRGLGLKEAGSAFMSWQMLGACGQLVGGSPTFEVESVTAGRVSIFCYFE